MEVKRLLFVSTQYEQDKSVYEQAKTVYEQVLPFSSRIVILLEETSQM